MNMNNGSNNNFRSPDPSTKYVGFFTPEYNKIDPKEITYDDKDDLEGFLKKISVYDQITNPKAVLKKMQDINYFEKRKLTKMVQLFDHMLCFGDSWPDILDYILGFVTFKTTDFSVATELMRAARMNCTGSVRKILEKLAEVYTSEDEQKAYINLNHKETDWLVPYPLHSAIQHGNLEMVKLLVEAGADILARGDRRNNALQCALRSWDQANNNDSRLAFDRQTAHKQSVMVNVPMQQGSVNKNGEVAYNEIFTFLLNKEGNKIEPKERLSYVKFILQSENYGALSVLLGFGWNLFDNEHQTITDQHQHNNGLYKLLLQPSTIKASEILKKYFSKDFNQKTSNPNYKNLLGLTFTALEISEDSDYETHQGHVKIIRALLDAVECDYGTTADDVHKINKSLNAPFEDSMINNFLREVANVKRSDLVIEKFKNDKNKNMFFADIDSMDKDAVLEVVRDFVAEKDVGLLVKALASRADIKIDSLHEKGIKLSFWMCCKFLIMHPFIFYDFVSPLWQRGLSCSQGNSASSSDLEEPYTDPKEGRSNKSEQRNLLQTKYVGP